jgi:ketosteroid isomerase-like protein
MARIDSETDVQKLIRNQTTFSSAILLIAATSTGCTSRIISPISGRQLVELDESWAAAAATDNLDVIMDYWTDDAVLYPEGQLPRYGKLAIREFIARRRSRPGHRISWTPTCAGVDEHGGMAYTLGEGSATIVDESGEPCELTGRYVAIWRWDNGRWRCAVKCWNSSPREATFGPSDE